MLSQPRRTHCLYDACFRHHPDHAGIEARHSAPLWEKSPLLLRSSPMWASSKPSRSGYVSPEHASGSHDVIDFVAILIGYALSGEPTRLPFYERLLPFARSFMALFARHQLPHRSTLSRFRGTLSISPPWKPCVRAFKRICWPANHFLLLVACSIGQASSGWSSM